MTDTIKRLDEAIVAVELCAERNYNHSVMLPEHDKTILAALRFAKAMQPRPIEEAPKTNHTDGWENKKMVLLKFKNDLSEYDKTGRLEAFQGVWFVACSHSGDHDLMGWSFSAPVGYGGFCDAWIEKYIPLPDQALKEFEEALK